MKPKREQREGVIAAEGERQQKLRERGKADPADAEGKRRLDQILRGDNR